MNDSTALGAPPDITDVGSAELVGAQPGEQAGQHQRQVTLGPVGAPRGLVVGLHHLEQRGDRRLGQGAGDRFGGLGPPDERHGIGGDQFGGMEEVAQHIPRRPHRRIDAGACADVSCCRSCWFFWSGSRAAGRQLMAARPLDGLLAKG